jgi:hypothetical protein
LIKHSWLESGGVYGYRKVHDDLREVGEDCGRHRVARLMRLEGLRSQTGYRRRPGKYGGKPAVASPNLLKRQFDVVEPNKVWVTDIAYIRTYEGWLYLAVVLDLFSRQVVGWSMKSQMTSDLAIDALLMAVWRRKPKQEVMVHSYGYTWHSTSFNIIYIIRTHGFTLGGRCWTDLKLCTADASPVLVIIDPRLTESQNAGHQLQRQRYRYQCFGLLGHLKLSGYAVNGYNQTILLYSGASVDRALEPLGEAHLCWEEI